MHVSGLRTDGLLAYNGRDLRRWVTLPDGVHNAQPFRDGVLFNDTAADVVRWVTRTAERTFPVPRFPAGASDARRRRTTRVSRARHSGAVCVSSTRT